MAELRIVFWNADGLSSQKARLFKTLLSQRRVDIGLISETHLRPVDKLKVSGYYVYREDHASPIWTAYRGLAVLVRRNVIQQLLPVPQLQTSYALGVEICIERQPTRVFRRRTDSQWLMSAPCWTRCCPRCRGRLQRETHGV
ncbi:unnamed protein product [Leptidea sinapis]|uniref:Endonuclease/exonuclease/phosphatase domain-containing protein n=1 Tax=Leptidea sinapis TaxID=189913 RepID=A0A5E4PTW8_9NEOP|nr:unnamed protein product [Leptidea sinapis]